MKYPLAIVNKLLDTFGANILIGYDIMCTFQKTIEQSSIASKAQTLNLKGAVNAFHGYSHNRGCQVHWHPNYIEGIGKEDLEGCE